MSSVGVDTYSYHRRLGEVRPGESAPAGPLWSWRDALDVSRRAGADVVALETCFMGAPDELDTTDLTAGPESCEVMLSWGHPYGIEYGASPEAERDLLSWLGVAAQCGHRAMRIVIGHWQVRDTVSPWPQVRGTVPALRRLAASAAREGVVLAIENHTDVTAEQLSWLLDEVGSPSL
ncbi:MAG: TIM barrel protein, partial [bacterium]|nr:TIM barrel protein [bacterium]